MMISENIYCLKEEKHDVLIEQKNNHSWASYVDSEMVGQFHTMLLAYRYALVHIGLLDKIEGLDYGVMKASDETVRQWFNDSLDHVCWANCPRHHPVHGDMTAL